MYYTESLRAWRMVRIFLIVFAALFVLCIVMRIVANGHLNETGYNLPPGHVKRTVLANGSQVTTVTGDRGEHVVVVRNPHGTEDITITEPAKKPVKGQSATMHVPGAMIQVTAHGRSRITHIHHNEAIWLSWLLVIASCVAAILAAMLALNLSRENDGHLELCWTKPVSRAGYALTGVAVDVAAIFVVGIAWMVLTVLTLAIFGEAHLITFDAGAWKTLLFSVAFPLSLYGLVVALTASMSRGAVFVLGLFWPVVLLFPLFSFIQKYSIGTIARVIDTINPAAYFYAFVGPEGYGSKILMLPATETMEILALCAIAILGVLASLAQWRRLEA
ncbi:MAG: hypothetical protein DLM50_07100 [Candidatus Meridianibacter frigidus]|nr:MAG: hypothetical protein DLM50_07100 [Candidatus Eremiobacteraeota bacterium]